ncbi:MAG TPA: hypothetical protein PKL24_25790 [Polyangiaceae bacterium]|nr:MAG: hypothetical protein BWY17_05304 [Deltaproteobacteria bacterium ADurb.Bin207]HNZ25584.1 hypothetical protein [Polyangiaceae bacterium]HOH03828.1 hypothetical protein [Polyangiaceae bacterium]HOR36480.1 hypothetical protein [Polyangiaceae bacterium]HPK94348.1 hypothetical protein [Polyangiaceae bacterium]
MSALRREISCPCRHHRAAGDHQNPNALVLVRVHEFEGIDCEGGALAHVRQVLSDAGEELMPSVLGVVVYGEDRINLVIGTGFL